MPRLDLNFVTMPRRAKMALGVLATLESTTGDGARLPLIPIEYNQLEPLLAATSGVTDANDSSGYSPFPGNTNAIFVSLPVYEQAIRKTGGAVSAHYLAVWAHRLLAAPRTRLVCLPTPRRCVSLLTPSTPTCHAATSSRRHALSA